MSLDEKRSFFMSRDKRSAQVQSIGVEREEEWYDKKETDERVELGSNGWVETPL
ncbi:hypothetical protein KSC_033500 [Ktedonobacter sp. SOSP1-52]|nr:hypothetical protein KSC_033500 [Ktedonobacter sp. SOSP1-52]